MRKLILFAVIFIAINCFSQNVVEVAKPDFNAVYPQGRTVRDIFTRSYGLSGVDDITSIYDQVRSKYSVDSEPIILAGQSAGGLLSLVENRFILHPDLGHGFPKDFKSQLDEGLKYLLEIK